MDPVSQGTPEHQILQTPTRHKTVAWVIILGSILCTGILLSLILLLFKHSDGKHAQPQAKKTQPTTTNNQVFSQIVRREHVNDQKHITIPGVLSAGFLDPNTIHRKVGKKDSLIKQVFAENNEQHPFLFYLTSSGTQITSLDLSTGETTSLFDLHTIPTIVFNNGTSIRKFSYLNSTKQIALEIVERLDTTADTDANIQQNLAKYKIAIDLYDIQSHTLKELVSTTGDGGSINNWRGFRVSPDEKYISAIFSNTEPVDPFADTQSINSASQSGSLTQGTTYNTTYFFYNLQTKQLNKFKSTLEPTGVISVVWQSDSSSLVVGSGFNYASVAQIFPDGKTSFLVNKAAPINHFLKVEYIPELQKVFYIGSKNTIDTDSQLGYYDLTTDTFTTVTPRATPSGSLNFTYDYQGGIVYDTFQPVTYAPGAGGITNRILNYYNPKTNQITPLTTSNLSVISFDGDYSHLLVSERIDNTTSKISDLNTKTGELQYLRDAPIISSVFTDNQ